MVDEDDGIHPLDRDYTQPEPVRSKKPMSADSALVTLGAVGFGLGFLVLLGAAIVLVNSPSGGPLETLGAFLHRFGMIIILVAGLSVIAAYRLPGLRSKLALGELKFRWNPGKCYRALVLWNVVFFFAINFYVLVFWQLTGSPGGVGFTYSATVTIGAAMMVTVAVWHRGYIRAFAIGVLAGLVFNGISGALTAWGMYGNGTGLSPLITNLAITQIAGLLCAFYVRMLEGQPSDDSELRKRG